MAPSKAQAKGRQDTTDDAKVLESLRETLNQLNKLPLSKPIKAPRVVLVGTTFECNEIVLESLSRIPFPVILQLRTSFTTELALKPTKQTKVHVIAPDQPFDGFSRIGFPLDTLPAIVDELKEQMRVATTNVTTNQVLQIKISGPDLPELTMVELANLGRGCRESTAGRRDPLSNEYLKEDSSIILGVFSGDGDLNSQSELEHQIKEHDPKRTRTFKVMTRPEKLSDSASQLPLDNPKEWHVLPGNPPSRESTPNGTEAKPDVSGEGRWSDIPQQNWGSENLQKKINTALLDNIRHRLPKSVSEISQLIIQHKSRLDDLGDHRKYMAKIASSYHKLADEALQNNYTDSFFNSPSSDNSTLSYEDRYIKKFRALVRNLNRAFSHIMVTKGHRRRILFGFANDPDDDDIDEDEGLDPSSPLAPLVELYDVEGPISVSMGDLESELQTMAPENEGTGSKDSAHEILALRLFRDQIRPWKTIAKHHVDLLTHFAHRFAEKLVIHSAGCDTKTAEALIKGYIDPYFDRKSIELEARLDELLLHYQHGYDFQQLYGAPSQISRQTVHQAGKAFLWLEGSSGDADASGLGANKIVATMETYYESALRVFIDYVAVLAVENCLVRDIPNIVNLDTVYGISDNESQRLATESRDELKNQLTKLEKVLAACQEYQPQKSNNIISRDLPLLRPPSLGSRPGTPGAGSSSKPRATFSPLARDKKNTTS
ncbi:hypothetical protein QBC43DRAFT_326163 [Cladorrhinum sp. PSN259]|nr:hypothetical protein QBC43DRAFT_326163 [Cladorrhinum sp. PSN259]